VTDPNTEVIALLEGIQAGRLVVQSYESKWIMKGKKMTNQRKLTILLEDTSLGPDNPENRPKIAKKDTTSKTAKATRDPVGLKPKTRRKQPKYGVPTPVPPPPKVNVGLAGMTKVM
jgi:hypothetical protein